MSKKLTKSKKKIPTNPQGIKKGDFIINRRGEILKVDKVTKKGFKILRKHIDGSWGSYGDSSFEENEGDVPAYIKLDKSEEELTEDLCNLIKSDLSDYQEKESESTDLILAKGADYVHQTKEIVTQKMNEIAVLERMLQNKKDMFHTVLSKLEDQVKAITKVIGIIELYLGVGEEIVQIQEGTPAPLDTPITFRQLVLHMDEEVAITEEQGLDFMQLEIFDDWVRKNHNSILPEKKGVVVCRPKREAKRYTGNAWVDSNINEENFKTYIFIKNGTDLYRIKTSHIIYPHLFPSQEEMEKIHNQSQDGWGFRKKDAKEELFKYKRNVLMLQGLIDRTQVFSPRPEGLSLMKPETCIDKVNFVYDGTNTITDGRPSYEKWLNKLNSKLKRGSRVFFKSFGYDDDKEYRMAQTGWESYRGESTVRDIDEGIYNIKRVEKDERRDKERLVVLHNPKDTVYRGGYYDFEMGERKRSNTYYLYRDDDMIINYDDVNPDDIEYYIKDRVNRENYLIMLPTLYGIMKAKREEQIWEEGFIELLKTQLSFKPTKKQIKEAIEWWKNKVIEVRPLKKEDAKALRMIKGYLKRNYGE